MIFVATAVAVVAGAFAISVAEALGSGSVIGKFFGAGVMLSVALLLHGVLT